MGIPKNEQLERQRMAQIKDYMNNRGTHASMTTKKVAEITNCTYQTAANFLRTSAFFEPTSNKGEFYLLKIPGMANSGPVDFRDRGAQNEESEHSIPVKPRADSEYALRKEGQGLIDEVVANAQEQRETEWKELNEIMVESDEQSKRELKQKIIASVPPNTKKAIRKTAIICPHGMKVICFEELEEKRG